VSPRTGLFLAVGPFPYVCVKVYAHRFALLAGTLKAMINFLSQAVKDLIAPAAGQPQ